MRVGAAVAACAGLTALVATVAPHVVTGDAAVRAVLDTWLDPLAVRCWVVCAGALLVTTAAAAVWQPPAARTRLARAGSRTGGSRAADGPRGRRDRVRGRGAGRAARRAARRRDGRGRSRGPVGHRRVAAPRRAAGHGAVSGRAARPPRRRRAPRPRRAPRRRRAPPPRPAPPRGSRGGASRSAWARSSSPRARSRSRSAPLRRSPCGSASATAARRCATRTLDAGRVRGHAQLDVGGRGARVVVPGAERGHRAATRRRRAGAADRHALRVPDGAGRGHRPGPRLQEPGEGHVRARGGVHRHGAPAAHADRAITAAARARSSCATRSARSARRRRWTRSRRPRVPGRSTRRRC